MSRRLIVFKRAQPPIDKGNLFAKQKKQNLAQMLVKFSNFCFTCGTPEAQNLGKATHDREGRASERQSSKVRE
jgi:hypothetical protein